VQIKILKSAQADLLDGYFFYERQKEGLGNYFIDTLFSDIESLQLFAKRNRKVFGYYRQLSKRFPFAIYYKIENEDIVVFAVLDCRQEPKQIENRLK